MTAFNKAHQTNVQDIKLLGRLSRDLRYDWLLALELQLIAQATRKLVHGLHSCPVSNDISFCELSFSST